VSISRAAVVVAVQELQALHSLLKFSRTHHKRCTMPSFVDAIPLHDDQNPCYCPIDAFTFIQTLRRRPLLDGSDEHELRASFTSRLLQKSADEELLDALHTNYNNSVSCFDYSLSSTVEGAYTVSPWKRGNGYIQTPDLFISNRSMSIQQHHSMKRKWRDESLDSITFSNLRSKRGRSDDIVNHDSFELSGKADKIRYSCVDYRFSPTAHTLPSTASTSQDTEDLLERIQALEGVSESANQCTPVYGSIQPNYMVLALGRRLLAA
jgi:hypothetical protein